MDTYKPIPSFLDWTNGHVLSTDRLDRALAHLKERGANEAQHLERAHQTIQRVAAIETGALEGLYEADRGFTFTVAGQMGLWEAELDRKGETTSRTIQTQLEIYTAMLQAAPEDRPALTASWIRALHAEICKDQRTHTVYTPTGQTLEKPMRLGQYKVSSNSVQTGEEVHHYAPPEAVAPQLIYMCDQSRTEAFVQAHPVYQASYIHYALTAIHPFADGNGRVSRAIASRFFVEPYRTPFLVLASEREAYFDALHAADQGDFGAFIDFTRDRLVSTIELIDESLRLLAQPSKDSLIQDLADLQRTKDGWSVEDVEQAMKTLFEELDGMFASHLEGLREQGGVETRVFRHVSSPQREGYCACPSHSLVIEFFIPSVDLRFAFLLSQYRPLNLSSQDHVILVLENSTYIFEVDIRDLVPVTRESVLLRLSLFVEGVVVRGLTKLREVVQSKEPS